MLELMCLAHSIFWESKGEPYRGQQMVAQVVLNRKRDSRYPNTICGVVKQPKQFSWYENNISLSNPPRIIYKDVAYKKHWDIAMNVAKCAIKSDPIPSNKSLFFNTKSLGVRYKTGKKPTIIGNHIFY